MRWIEQRRGKKKKNERRGKRDEPARKERGKKNTDTIANENIISFDL